jgi:hypothetical protein
MRIQSFTAEKSPHFFLVNLCFTRFLLHLSLQNYPALIPVLQQQWQMSSAGAIAPTVFGAILDWTNPSPATAGSEIVSHWGWAFSALGLGALIGPWAMVKLRSLPESVKMAGGKK